MENVVDSAGFKFLTDLVLAVYLQSAGQATQIVLHDETLPWSISDVMTQDVKDLIDAFTHGDIFGVLDREFKDHLNWFGAKLKRIFDRDR